MKLSVITAALTLLLSSCVNMEEEIITTPSVVEETVIEEAVIEEAFMEMPEIAEPVPVIKSLINPSGRVLRDRFIVPDGYTRVEVDPESFAAYLQNLPLKPYGAKVKYYDGREKTDRAYYAVVDYDLGSRDLQQCADGVMRLRAEYLYKAGRAEDIQFYFVNGFKADFKTWSEGNTVSINGNNVSWVKKALNDSSYESLQKYLDIVYAFSSTLSLDQELKAKETSEMQIGDVFIKGGSPGHCVIVVDMAKNPDTGEGLFMLAQSYMPAQDIQILKNPNATEDYLENPWYSLDFGEKLLTPEWTFESNSLKSW